MAPERWSQMWAASTNSANWPVLLTEFGPLGPPLFTGLLYLILIHCLCEVKRLNWRRTLVSIFYGQNLQEWRSNPVIQFSLIYALNHNGIVATIFYCWQGFSSSVCYVQSVSKVIFPSSHQMSPPPSRSLGHLYTLIPSPNYPALIPLPTHLFPSPSSAPLYTV